MELHILRTSFTDKTDFIVTDSIIVDSDKYVMATNTNLRILT